MASTPWWYRPRDGWTTTGDALRAVGVASMVLAPVLYGWVAVPLFALVLLGLVLLRLRDVPASADPPGGVVLLAAGWFAILDVYARVPALDLVVHAAAGGVGAPPALVVAQGSGVLRGPDDLGRKDPRPVVAYLGVAGALGVALGYVWELLEWAGHTWVDPTIHIPYADTMTDMAACGLGALLAGSVGLRLRGRPGHAASGRPVD